MSDTSNCVSCRAEIMWRPTLAGNRMPIDPEPVAGGNVALKEIAGVEYALVVDSDRATHVAHFSTCPAADEHRRRSPRRPGAERTVSSTGSVPEPTLPFGGDA